MRSLSDASGSWLLLYFYPKDSTPGCTQEACAFRDAYADLTSAGVTIWGVSADSEKSHVKFAETHKLPFPLLSDPTHAMIESYGAWGNKKFMGREFTGILRISYLIDPSGVVRKVYDPVKPAGHAAEVLQDVKVFNN